MHVGRNNGTPKVSRPFDDRLLLGGPGPTKVYLDVELVAIVDGRIAARVCRDKAAASPTTTATRSSAMDYTRANSIKSAMQAAADATALKLVQNALSLPSGDVSATADPVFKASFSRPDAAQLQISAQSTSSGVVTVTATAQMATDFMGVLGITNIVIGSRTVAMKTPGDGKGCVLALNRSASGTITAQGSTTINLNGCSMY